MKRKTIVGVGVGALLLVSMPHTLSPVLRHKEEPPVVEQTKATWAEKKENKRLAKRVAWQGYGWRKMEWRCIDYIFTKESRYDHLAKNRQGSSAFGIGQRLKETSKDPLTQILHAYKYIRHRYETPCQAMNFHLRHNHY